MAYQFHFIEARLLGLLLLALALFISGCEQGATKAVAPHKPSNPLQLTIQPLDAITPGGTVRFEALLSSHMSFTDVLLEITLPAALSLQSGTLQWRGAISPGQTQRIGFSLTIPTQGEHRITATASLQRGQLNASRRAFYVIGGDRTQPAAAVGVQRPTTPASSGGDPVIEYELR